MVQPCCARLPILDQALFFVLISFVSAALVVVCVVHLEKKFRVGWSVGSFQVWDIYPAVVCTFTTVTSPIADQRSRNPWKTNTSKNKRAPLSFWRVDYTCVWGICLVNLLFSLLSRSQGTVRNFPTGAHKFSNYIYTYSNSQSYIYSSFLKSTCTFWKVNLSLASRSRVYFQDSSLCEEATSGV